MNNFARAHNSYLEPPDDDPVCEILLTKGQKTLVDRKNYEWLSQWKWFSKYSKSNDSYYAVRMEGKDKNRKVIRMHREIAKTPVGMDCDHINHNTLDNTESNLRNVTRSQNMMNRKGANSNNKLGEKGIYRNGNGFSVQVMFNGKWVYTKWFKTLGEAIVGRNKALKKYHGEFSEVQNEQ